MLANVDNPVGMLPCKALGYWEDGPMLMIQVKLTANRDGYDRGEILSFPAFHVYPRRAWKYSRRSPFHINVTAYKWRDLVPEITRPR